LIKFKPHGNLDFAGLKEGVREIASVSGAFIEYDVLVDTRGAEVHLSVFDIWGSQKTWPMEYVRIHRRDLQ